MDKSFLLLFFKKEDLSCFLACPTAQKRKATPRGVAKFREETSRQRAETRCRHRQHKPPIVNRKLNDASHHCD
jgi:hypothetical protein